MRLTKKIIKRYSAVLKNRHLLKVIGCVPLSGMLMVGGLSAAQAATAPAPSAGGTEITNTSVTYQWSGDKTIRSAYFISFDYSGIGKVNPVKGNLDSSGSSSLAKAAATVYYTESNGTRTYTLSNLTLDNNDNNAISINSGIVEISGTNTFKNNAASSGAAISNTGNLNFTGENTFANNKATSMGGAIYILNGTVTFNGTNSFSENTAKNERMVVLSITERLLPWLARIRLQPIKQLLTVVLSITIKAAR